MLHKISKIKKCAPRLIFFYKFFFIKIRLIFDVGNQILALFDGYFWPFNKSHEKIKSIFVISAFISSIWNVFIKFRWHDEKLSLGAWSLWGAWARLEENFWLAEFSVGIWKSLLWNYQKTLRFFVWYKYSLQQNPWKQQINFERISLWQNSSAGKWSIKISEKKKTSITLTR